MDSNTRKERGYHRNEKLNGVNYLVHVEERPGDVELDPPQKLTTVTTLEEIGNDLQNGTLKTLFSPIQKGDLRNSVMTFLTASVGAGILSIPQIFSFYGIILSIVLLAIFAWMNYETYKIIDRAIILSGKKGYGNMCSYYFGEKWARVCNIGIMTVLLVVCCIYASITWNSLEHLLNSNNIVSLPLKDLNTGAIDESSNKTFLVRLISMVIICTLTLPLVLIRQLTSLRYVTSCIMIVIAYIFVVTLLQTPGSIKHYIDKDSYQIDLLPPEISMDWISGIGAFSMSYSCQPIYFYIRNEMKYKRPDRTRMVYRIGVTVEFIIYVMFGLSGYLSLGKENIPVIFTQRISIIKSDILMSIARWAFFPLIALHILIPFITLRESIIQYNNLRRTKTTVFFLSLLLSVLVFSLPVVYPDVLSLIGIFGGLFSGFFCCVVFFIIGFRSTKSKLSKVKYFTCSIIFIWSAFSNTYASIYKAFMT